MNIFATTIIIGAIAIIFPNELNMTHKKTPQISNVSTEWILAKMVLKMPEEMKLRGKPEILKCKYGKAVAFNGSTDAIFLEKMPLTGLSQFTIEMIIQPQSGGNFEQRFLHCGETQGDRILLELRAIRTDWYFDAFIATGEQKCTLIDPNLLHPLDQWYHLAYVIDNGKLETYVNGKKELEGNIVITPLKSGKTSIGVRQNEVSWFRGAIYDIRFTGKALTPKDFMNY
jgi:hypothetical protein